VDAVSNEAVKRSAEGGIAPHGQRPESPPLIQAIEAARDWLLTHQQPDGHWCGELEGDTILESETILLLAFLGRESSPLARKAARYLVKQQLPGGGWAMYPGGRLDISGSVKAYFALKVTGHDPESEPMQRARRAILAAGGADRVNSFTRFFLALLGQIPYAICPAVPPEFMLLPSWSPVNIYRISSWSRTIFVPLSIVWAHQPCRKLSAEQGIGELMVRPPAEWPDLCCPGLEDPGGLLSWHRFFRQMDRGVKILERWQFKPLRRISVRAARRWMLERFRDSDGLGAIFPPIIFSAVALRSLGYRLGSPEMQACLNELEKLVIEEGGAVRLEPCKSPVWDTAITLRALAAAGSGPSDPALERAARWLLDREVREPGDWSKTAAGRPGGWFFEYRNVFYPDVDDTVMVLMALREAMQADAAGGDNAPPSTANSRPNGLLHAAVGRANSNRGDARRRSHQRRLFSGRLPRRTSIRVGRSRISNGPGNGHAAVNGHAIVNGAHARRDSQQTAHVDGHAGEPSAAAAQRLHAACRRGLAWVLAMQNRDGGWGAFDKDNDAEFLCHVPFADHNAMIDPSTPDLAARVLEMLGSYNRRLGDPVVDRAVAYVRGAQEPDGSWFGRWGVNYIYGTWQAIVGLSAAGVPSDDPAIVRAADWLEEFQQPDGGWGESPHTYDNPGLRGSGAHLAPPRVIKDQRDDRLGPRFGGFGAEHEARLAVTHHFLGPALIGDDHRQARALALHHHLPERVGRGGEHEQVRARVQR